MRILFFLLVAAATPIIVWSLLSGNPLRYYVKPVFLRIVGFGALMMPSAMGFASLSVRTSHETINAFGLPLLQIALGSLLVLKGALALCGWFKVRKGNLIPTSTLRTGALIWLGVAVSAVAAFSYALAPVASPWVVAATVVLILPVSRILWQVIGLDRTRHNQI